MKRLGSSLGLVVALALATSGPAGAQSTQANETQAKTYFKIGAQAFAMQKYGDAILAFEKAYAASPRPGVKFSMAQAYRRRYGQERKIEDGKRALSLFRSYVDEVKTGARVEDALAAIGELEASVGKAEPAVAGGAASGEAGAAPKPAAAETMLMVGASQMGARISLDGAAPTLAPLTKVVTPGKHKVRVTAEGFAPEERVVDAIARQTVAYDVTLRELPAELTVAVEAGAEISVDGRYVGTTPLPRPLELTPGRHLVVVGKAGRRSVAAELWFSRGQTRRMTVKLAWTGQRALAVGLLGTSAVALVTGGVLGVVAFKKQEAAQDLEEQRQSGALARAADYNEAKADRDRFRAAAAATLGGGAAIGLGGLLAFGLDPADLSGANPRIEPEPKKPGAAPPAMPSMEMGAAPLFGPHFAGAMLGGRF